MNCPSCEALGETPSVLSERSFEGVLLKTCSCCTGFWTHPEELKLVLETTDKAFEEPNPARPKPREAVSPRCPECNAEMDFFHFMLSSQIYLDQCPQGHGVWVPGGTLPKLLAFYQRFKKQPKPAQKTPVAQAPEFEL